MCWLKHFDHQGYHVCHLFKILSVKTDWDSCDSGLAEITIEGGRYEGTFPHAFFSFRWHFPLQSKVVILRGQHLLTFIYWESSTPNSIIIKVSSAFQNMLPRKLNLKAQLGKKCNVLISTLWYVRFQIENYAVKFWSLKVLQETGFPLCRHGIVFRKCNWTCSRSKDIQSTQLVQIYILYTNIPKFKNNTRSEVSSIIGELRGNLTLQQFETKRDESAVKRGRLLGWFAIIPWTRLKRKRIQCIL